MADFRDNNWDTDTHFFQVNIDYGDGHIDTFKGLPDPVTKEEEYMLNDKPDKTQCPVCKKERIVTRCIIHVGAKGCSYCHYQKEHK